MAICKIGGLLLRHLSFAFNGTTTTAAQCCQLAYLYAKFFKLGMFWSWLALIILVWHICQICHILAYFPTTNFSTYAKCCTLKQFFIGSLKSEKIGSLESEKSGPYRSIMIPGT